eukprot:TRINITY_DN4827_c0_g6_i1.p1 TRINITY_DN4827_c0_g6~~TRINITY_DN4827_c0_g6_i1.p1  ORF type:complete len:408 (+),score=117.08 TRINITY_DN4827_c0_g6_i1:328-1551(+)
MHHLVESHDKYIMVTELSGPSLAELLVFSGGKFSLGTVLMVAEEVLTKIEYVHSKNFVHRNVKPENFLIGINDKSSRIQIVGFGSAKRYKDVKTRHHVSYKETKSFIGTARYASINAHFGIELTRRDDLESIGYMLLYFLKGKLPWQGMQGSNKAEKYRKIMQKKLLTPIDLLCIGAPIELAKYLRYCRALRFEDRPDYTMLKRLMREAMFRAGGKYDYRYDWTRADPTAHLHENCVNAVPLIGFERERKALGDDITKEDALKGKQIDVNFKEMGAIEGKEVKKEEDSKLLIKTEPQLGEKKDLLLIDENPMQKAVSDIAHIPDEERKFSNIPESLIMQTEVFGEVRPKKDVRKKEQYKAIKGQAYKKPKATEYQGGKGMTMKDMFTHEESAAGKREVKEKRNCIIC